MDAEKLYRPSNIVFVVAASKARIRRWGSSLGVVIPSPTAKELRLKPGDEVLIDVRLTGGVSEAFGSLKGWNVDSLKLKEDARRGW